MKNKLISILLVTASLLLLGFAAQAQQTQPSIEQQIKQKEAELERLREIKKRQDKVRELQDEIRRLTIDRRKSNIGLIKDRLKWHKRNLGRAISKRRPFVGEPACIEVTLSLCYIAT